MLEAHFGHDRQIRLRSLLQTMVESEPLGTDADCLRPKQFIYPFSASSLPSGKLE